MNVKFCDFCGKEIPEHAIVCPFCKMRLDSNEISSNSDNNLYSNSANEDEVDDNQKFGETEIFSISKEKQVPLKPSHPEFSEDDYTRAFNIVDDKDFTPQRDLHQPAERNYQQRNVRANPNNRTQSNPNRNTNENYNSKKSAKGNKSSKNEKKKAPIILIIVLVIVLAAVILLLVNKINGKNNAVVDTSTTATTTTETTIKATVDEEVETTTQAATSTVAQKSTQDISGFLGGSFSTIRKGLDEQVSSPQDSEGTTIYYYDGLELTVSEDTIIGVDVDYATISDKDAFSYKDVDYYSDYSDVLSKLGNPNENTLGNGGENYLGYYLENKSKYIKILFDSSQKVCGYSLFFSN